MKTFLKSNQGFLYLIGIIIGLLTYIYNRDQSSNKSATDELKNEFKDLRSNQDNIKTLVLENNSLLRFYIDKNNREFKSYRKVQGLIIKSINNLNKKQTINSEDNLGMYKYMKNEIFTTR